MNPTEEEILWLAALLHDIGKFNLRVGGDYYAKHAVMSESFVASLRDYLGAERARLVADLAGSHHSTPTTRAQRLLHVADKLAALERESEPRAERLNSDEAALLAVATRVEFRVPCGSERYYPLRKLSLSEEDGKIEEVLFPGEQSRVEPQTYRVLWDRFVAEMRQLAPYRPTDFTTLLALLRVYGARIPSATPWEYDAQNRTVPDISLYDHTKVTTAIAACLGKLDHTALSEERLSRLIELLRRFREADFTAQLADYERGRAPLAQFVRGDVSGIQSYIYRITRADEPDTAGVARRLRGRSFTVALLTQILADWLVRATEVTAANVLRVGGGGFDVLLPSTEGTEPALQSAQDKVFAAFNGEVSVLLTAVPLWAHDFADFGRVYEQAAAQLGDAKQRRHRERLADETFVVEPLRPQSPEAAQGLAEEAEIVSPADRPDYRLGEALPRTTSLAFVYESEPREDECLFAETRFQAAFGTSVLLLDDRQWSTFLHRAGGSPAVISRLNAPHDFLVHQAARPVGQTFQFLAHEVPTRHGHNLDFEHIAELSEGMECLGVLKMDVDFLGLVFGRGLELPSLSRLSTLSSELETFFGAWLGRRCRALTEEWRTWRQEQSKPPPDVDRTIFYTLYAGGDDVFVLGPWNWTTRLVQELAADFRRLTGENPNLSVSAGVVNVKPKFPLPRAAELAERELKRAKAREGDPRSERADPLARGDRVSLFREVVPWMGSGGAKELLDFSDALAREVAAQSLPRAWLRFLLDLRDLFGQDPDEVEPQAAIPLRYQVGRLRDKEVLTRLDLLYFPMRNLARLRIPVSQAILKLRKER